jgi:hypothetical protein
MGTRTCARPNLAEIALDGFDPQRDVVVADLAALVASSDLSADAGGAPGCMGQVDDPECAILEAATGIGGAQQLFRVARRTE